MRLRETEDRLYQIDAETGTILGQVSWHYRNPETQFGIQLFALDDETVLFRSGNVLKVLSAELVEIHSRTLATSINNLELRDAILSSDSRSAVLKYADGGIPAAQNYWFSPHTLDQITVEPAPHYSGTVAVTDEPGEYYAMNEESSGSRSHPVVYFVEKMKVPDSACASPASDFQNKCYPAAC